MNVKIAMLVAASEYERLTFAVAISSPMEYLLRAIISFASFYYYCASVGSRIDDAERTMYARRADRFWLLGYTLLFLDPSLILFSVGLLAVGCAWFALWLVYLLFVILYFPKVLTARRA